MIQLRDLIKARDTVAIKAYMREHGLILKEGKIVPKDEQVRSGFKEQEGFWNQRQQARKILLNSLTH